MVFLYDFMHPSPSTRVFIQYIICTYYDQGAWRHMLLAGHRELNAIKDTVVIKILFHIPLLCPQYSRLSVHRIVPPNIWHAIIL